MNNCLSRVIRKCSALVAVLTVFVATSQSAFAQVTLPTTGVDVEGHVTAAITALGTIVTVAVGGYFGFMLVMKGLRWARKFAG